ncbi:lipoprotein insertase outer membrane protein LolB [Psychrobacter sp. HD31]|uniref:lipoprotein insertase outer membrane protein LolB n=1 Tax=Psychrobacter sp. HD31 TaxID=3112003 RepID=UPI003DA41359
MKKHLTILKALSTLALATTLLSGCQTMHQQPTVNPINTNKMLTPKKLAAFNIDGKIGIVNTVANQAGSAFYVWAQEDERFTIELQGALGIGFTRIQYNGQTATLENADVGTIAADDPDALLLQATGWQAPISQLPYWISGSPAPTDSSQALDSQYRLLTATNGDWAATFNYTDDNKLPRKIISTNTNGSKVTMIIKHQQ